MNNRYTPQRAEQLVPILRSISSEIVERSRAIEQLEGILESAAAKRNPPIRQMREVGATLAHHRRELRFAKQELARLGCAPDEDHPLRIRIPGEDGTLETGYTWIPSEQHPRRNEAVNAVDAAAL